MNKLFKLLILPFQGIYFLIVLPFKVMHFVISTIIDGLVFVWNKFLSLFKFSLAFKISVYYFLTMALAFFLITSTVIFSYKVYLEEFIPRWMIEDSQRINSYLEANPEINPKELIGYFSDENAITIRQNNQNILTHQPKEMMETSEDLLQYDPLGLETIATPMTYTKNNYSIEVMPYINNYQAIAMILIIAFSVVSFLILVIITLLGNKVNRHMFQPIRNMTDSAKKISGNNLNQRIDVANSYDELKELGETFNQMMNRIESSYRKQKQFVNDASHELRTPIAVIQGYSNLLSRWGKDDEKILLESIDAIKDESEHMKSLVNSLLFLARADKNETKLDRSTFLINDLLEELIKENRLIDSSHIFSKSIEGNLLMNADRKLIKQALRIFIQNSIKFTPEGGKITLKAFSDENDIVIDICDTGIGIPKKDLGNIFDRFYRADESRTKNKGGTGLGLSIAKWIISAHEGRILIRSTVDIGTDIRLILPYKSSQSKAKEKSSKADDQ
ncbi:MAG TPA: ATP-binding protein [Clostridia bacterium]|nr:ATP-binding protein [Clostridia bacterium]